MEQVLLDRGVSFVLPPDPHLVCIVSYRIVSCRIVSFGLAFAYFDYSYEFLMNLN